MRGRRGQATVGVKPPAHRWGPSREKLDWVAPSPDLAIGRDP
jgi:hypothetical protein